MPAHSKSNRLTPLFILLALCLQTLAGCSKPQTTDKVEKAAKVPQRIVSLAPSLTEMLYAIGAGPQLVGRTSACDWPAEAEKVPVAGSFGRPSLEVLASMNPDLVLDVDLADEQAAKKMAEMHLRREHIRCQDPEELPAALRKLGALTGHVRQADSLASVIEKGLAEYRKEAATKTHKPSIYLEIWNDPLWTGGRNSFVSRLISYAGGRNIGDAVEKEYFEVSPEWVIRENPDVIACMYMANQTPAADNVKKRPGWQGISAVRNNRVYDQFDNRLYLRPGPRILEGIAGMKKLIESNEE
ncbi:cobalamin-binding protein [Chlorobaculum sp. MV4-Y]|jgi:iron complex transport system substrate-binding protein|uniref:cobalamin-binding protein n=1 Tax=Chlorobaculum sp. MV4-Y TaxID=2976335 RepID=UPI0021B057FE|nr:cobalamin-binding protein [Chlorobaculum sp. MV4-Y]UWX58392.1 cobalamin-binding protein [Chlorobaculum sp. MV4-Y]